MVTVITEQQARELTQGFSAQALKGYSEITASGHFDRSWRVADGSSVECYINFGWPKYFLVPKGYREPESWISRRDLRY